MLVRIKVKRKADNNNFTLVMLRIYSLNFEIKSFTLFSNGNFFMEIIESKKTMPRKRQLKEAPAN